MFKEDIERYNKFGSFDYNFDNSGNVVLSFTGKEFSNHYLSIPLSNIGLIDGKVSEFYNLEFEEFVEENKQDNSVIAKEEIQSENLALKQEISDLLQSITKNEETNATDLSIKQVIIELRKNLGEGSVESDFSSTFPYTAIKKEKVE